MKQVRVTSLLVGGIVDVRMKSVERTALREDFHPFWILSLAYLGYWLPTVCVKG